MNKNIKKELSETDICDQYITPAIKDANWDPTRQIRREVTLTPGPIIVRGNMSARNKKAKKFADTEWEYQDCMYPPEKDLAHPGRMMSTTVNIIK